MNSPADAQIRRLLDQRSARSEFSAAYDDGDLDTPSIYSHAYFSPARSSSPDNSIMHERNTLNDLAVSMLEFDDEPAEDSADDDVSRMSMLGPKMRFHSKAPWELDAMLEEEEEAQLVMQQHHLQSRRSTDTDSSRLLVSNKRSFETTTSRSSYVRNIQLASVSSSSLATQPRKPSLFGRIPSRSDSPQLSPISARAPPSFMSSQTPSIMSRNDEAPTSRFSYPDEEQAHPYANADYALAEPSPRTPQQPSIPFPSQYVVARSDSVGTVTTDPFPPSSPSPPRSHASLHGREISSPILRAVPNSVPNDPKLASPPLVATSLTGWNGVPPSFNLISLEEARSQRTRSASAQVPPSARVSTSSGLSRFPPADVPSGRQSPISSIATRSRARSISTGAGVRAKQALHNMVGGPQPSKSERQDSGDAGGDAQIPGRSLKHKKSGGFMRLFNGGRDTPPPMPSLSDGFTAFNAAQAAPKPPKVTAQRVPVPSLPSLDDIPVYSAKPSPKRTPPPLSIHTTPSIHFPRPPASAIGETFSSRLGVPSETTPQSAPPNVTEFPALKLRPVSTMFSAHFTDHIIPRGVSSPDLDSDTQGSLSPNTVISPITPGLFLGRHDQHGHSVSLTEQSSTVKALQEQIVSAKKAWQRHIWELEGQVRDLRAEVEDFRAKEGRAQCSKCGGGLYNRAIESDDDSSRRPTGVVNRPRARTGTGTSRFGATS